MVLEPTVFAQPAAPAAAAPPQPAPQAAASTASSTGATGAAATNPFAALMGGMDPFAGTLLEQRTLKSSAMLTWSGLGAGMSGMNPQAMAQQMMQNPEMMQQIMYVCGNHHSRFALSVAVLILGILQ